MLKLYALSTLEKTLNRCIRLDPVLPDKLKTFEGKTIELMLLPFEIRVVLLFSQGRIVILEEWAAAASLEIRGTPFAMIKLGLSEDKHTREALARGSLHMTGDLQLGQKVKQVFQSMDIDWETHLSEITGDLFARQLGLLVRKGRSFIPQMSDTLGASVTDFLQEEAALCPTPIEVTRFCNAVDALRFDLDRLSEKIRFLYKDYPPR